MLGWNFEISLRLKTCIAKLKFKQVFSFIIKASIVCQLRAFVCGFSKSETSINFSVSDQQDFVKLQNFAVMTSL